MRKYSERRARERQEARLRIVEAAREIFATGGEEALTLRRVAQSIEYSATAIYLHFKNKEDLVREVCAADFAAFSRRMVQAERTADALERLKKVAAGYVDFGLQYPAQYRAMFITSAAELAHPEPDKTHSTGLAKSRAGSTSMVSEPPGNAEKPLEPQDFLHAAVFKALAAGLFKPEYRDVSLITQTFWAALHGVIALHQVRAKFPAVAWWPIQALAEMTVECVSNGMIVPSATTPPFWRLP